MIAPSKIFKPLAHVTKLSTFDEEIRILPDPEQVIIPLEYPGQILYKPQVKAGDRVRQNQIIGRSARGNCVHASISGTVREIKPIWTTRGFNVPAAVIDRNDDPPLSMAEMYERSGMKDHSVSRIDQSKLSGVISPWTLPGRFHHEEDVTGLPEIKHVIIKGVNEEPTIFVFELLLQHRAEKIIRGIRELKNLAPNAKIRLTVPRRLSNWGIETFDRDAEVIPLSDEYRSRIERMMVKKVTGLNIPNTFPYRLKGVAVISVEYLLRLIDALENERPFIYKHLTLAGFCLPRPVTVRSALGTPVRAILASQGLEEITAGRILIGGPMKGHAQFTKDTPLTKSFHGLYLMSHEEIPEEINLTCINCGRCTRACPVNLQVHLIGRYMEYGYVNEARALHPEACHECGLCAYVCPAHRPMVQLIRVCNQDERSGGSFSG